jgi:hypothetical protein
MFGLFKKKRPPPPPRDFPPAQKWRPTIAQSVDEIAERAAFYTNRARDFVVFRNGTCVFVPNRTRSWSALSEPRSDSVRWQP